MGVDDALRPAGRPARVAHGRGLALVEVRLLPVGRVCAGEQLLVGVLDDEDVLDVGLVLELLQQREERLVDDHGFVAAVLRDVADVARMQAQVERVQDEPSAGDPEVRLEVLIVVPAEGADAVAGFESQPREPHGELLRAARHVGVRVAVEALVRQAGDDFALAKERLGPAQQRRQRQLEVHHQPVHRPSLLAGMRIVAEFWVSGNSGPEQ